MVDALYELLSSSTSLTIFTIIFLSHSMNFVCTFITFEKSPLNRPPNSLQRGIKKGHIPTLLTTSVIMATILLSKQTQLTTKNEPPVSRKLTPPGVEKNVREKYDETSQLSQHLIANSIKKNASTKYGQRFPS